MRRVAVVAAALSLLATAGPAIASRAAAPPSEPAADTATKAPALTVTRQVRNLEHPWDVKPLGDGRLLISERDSRRLLVWSGGRLRSLSYPRGSVWVSGETGLMSLAVDPNFAKNKRFYACHGGFAGGLRHDVRITAFRLDLANLRAVRVRTLLSGIQATSGRHGGCRLLIQRGGALLVGTGDAAVGTNPRNLDSLNGKVLRLNRFTGKPWPGNPFIGSANTKRRYVVTYGHRNIQGLAQRADGSLWSVEHGSFRDDEVNRIFAGSDYGWHPVPGYNEEVPMTDHSLPGAQAAARWRSGDPTVATSGATWVKGKRWGVYDGTLAVACLKDSKVIFMKFDRSGKLLWTRAPAALQQDGRLRSVTRVANGDLLITTANGTEDVVLRVRPRG
ncbi:PQQ-dependent sugar dehydrogenase [Nocardioides speluncae]|uniref:PQQ-dependent sugar dehydrogenase n=1 Tax=Nocardioides speluncae TaxID=2670337 RepID=UPI000D691D5D|nr:PQQ-dependent sugar dehydrogenase [Nocardioides speluncae]